jgi:glycosyltransferase involved in cell wall biosynthesis
VAASVAILVPTLRRPHALAPLLESLEANTPAGSYSVVFVLDHDDHPTYREINRLGRPYTRVMVEDGTYPHKINAAAAASEESWLLLTADDVRFHPLWWERAQELMVPGAEGQIMEHLEPGVIGTYDLHNRHTRSGKYATQILVARWYLRTLGTIDEVGKAFHEGYHHNCIDVEICETAKARGLYAHTTESIIEHLHPDHGNRPVDETDAKGNRANRHADQALLQQRRALWAT